MRGERKRKVSGKASTPPRAYPAGKRFSYFVLASNGAPWLKLRVTEIGESFWQPGKNCSRSHSERLAWEMVIAGRIRLVQDGRTAFIGPNEAFLLKRGVAHSYHAEGVAVHKIYIGLDGDLAESMMQNISDRIVLPNPAMARRQFAKMRTLFNAQSDGWHMQASCLAYEMLVSCQVACFGHRTNQQRHPAVRQILPLLERGDSRTHSIADLASRSGISTAQLYRLFRREYSTTPQRYARAHLLQVIRHALAEGDESIQEVASRFGYSDPAYFSAWFKRETGTTPSLFRRRNRQS